MTDLPHQAWEAYLLGEAWGLRVVELRAGRLLVTCTVPRAAGPGIPMTLLYRSGPQGWTLLGQVPRLSRPALLDDHRLVGLHGHDRGETHLCSFEDNGGGHRSLTRLPGPARAVAYQGDRAVILAGSVGDPFSRSRVAHLNVVGLDEADQVQTLVLECGDAEPTGELVMADGLIVLGTARDDDEGRRRIGLHWLRPGDGRTGEIQHPDRDLHGLVPLSGRGWAVRASTRHHRAGQPLRHELWWTAGQVTDDSWTRLEDGRQTWLEPVAGGPQGPIALGIHQGVRSLYRPDRDTGRASVSSFVRDDTGEAWVESSALSPPALWFRSLPEGTPELVDRGERPPWSAAVLQRYRHRVGHGRRRHPTGSQVLIPSGPSPRAVIALFHGGPTMAWADWSWRWNPGPYLQQGYAIVLVDPAGSDGYGSRSWQAAWRSWRPGIVPSAVDTLTEARERAGLADLPLVTVGGSFGGYLALSVAGILPTVLAAAHATPVRPREVALASEAFWSWTREWGPLHERAAALESESLSLSSIGPQCQVLLSHGLLDDQVPFQQSVSAARELRLRRIPCELALIPGAGHALTRADWTSRWYKWVLDALNTRGIRPHGEESGTAHGRGERP